MSHAVHHVTHVFHKITHAVSKVVKNPIADIGLAAGSLLIPGVGSAISGAVGGLGSTVSSAGGVLSTLGKVAPVVGAGASVLGATQKPKIDIPNPNVPIQAQSPVNARAPVKAPVTTTNNMFSLLGQEVKGLFGRTKTIFDNSNFGKDVSSYKLSDVFSLL